MDAFGVLDEVLGDYRSFVTGFLNIQDDRVCAKVDTEIESGLLWPEPWLALNPAFEPDGPLGRPHLDRRTPEVSSDARLLRHHADWKR